MNKRKGENAHEAFYSAVSEEKGGIENNEDIGPFGKKT